MTFDTGALIAADRDDRRFWTFWKCLTLKSVVVNVPAPVLAQAWRGPRNARMAKVISGCRIIPMQAREGWQVGELCGLTATHDVVDAFVVVSAASRGDDILTGDPGDLRALAAHVPGVGRIRTLRKLGE